MTETFQTRISTLTDAELIRYLAHFQDYRTEAVEAALAESDRRGLALPADELVRIQAGLKARATAAQAKLNNSFVTSLGDSLEIRLLRIRQITFSLLAIGLGGAVMIYLLVTPRAANPLGFEPEDSKKYLRDMEVFGGKVNVLASQIRATWNELWYGHHLAFTVAGLCLFLAFAFWFIATRRARDLEDLGNESGHRKKS
jgi:hypothetical protein